MKLFTLTSAECISELLKEINHEILVANTTKMYLGLMSSQTNAPYPWVALFQAVIQGPRLLPFRGSTNHLLGFMIAIREDPTQAIFMRHGWKWHILMLLIFQGQKWAYGYT